jgi:uncharacterized DUF497 family protein
MKLEWNPEKADNNLRTYGVSFEEAMTVFFSARRATKNEIKDYEKNARKQAP